MRCVVLLIFCFIIASPFTQMTPSAQTQSPAPRPPDTVYLLLSAHVFDGESAQLHEGLGRLSAWRRSKRLVPQVKSKHRAMPQGDRFRRARL